MLVFIKIPEVAESLDPRAGKWSFPRGKKLPCSCFAFQQNRTVHLHKVSGTTPEIMSATPKTIFSVTRSTHYKKRAVSIKVNSAKEGSGLAIQHYISISAVGSPHH